MHIAAGIGFRENSRDNRNMIANAYDFIFMPLFHADIQEPEDGFLTLRW